MFLQNVVKHKWLGEGIDWVQYSTIVNNTIIVEYY